MPDLQRALDGLVLEHEFAAQEHLHITTVRRWAANGWIVSHKRGRRRYVDIEATKELWRHGGKPSPERTAKDAAAKTVKLTRAFLDQMPQHVRPRVNDAIKIDGQWMICVCLTDDLAFFEPLGQGECNQ